MDADELNSQPLRSPFEPPEWTLLDSLPELASDSPPPRRTRRVWLPVVLFCVTCVSTLVAGTGLWEIFWGGEVPELSWSALLEGLMYSGAVMTILLCHEMGHFIQSVRYGVYASLPYFIPMPSPIGTFGAVIFMDPRRGDRKAIFDIGISGPLAGLVPTLIFLCLGLHWSHPVPIVPGEQVVFGEPLLMRYLAKWLADPIPDKFDLALHPLAFAGWVGLLITSINLIPIGQLDGGHVLYGMFRKKAHVASAVVLVAAISASIALRLQSWWLMLGLIAILGTRHPPTADDSVPLGAWRYVLGVVVLAFLFLGFTPIPMSISGH